PPPAPHNRVPFYSRSSLYFLLAIAMRVAGLVGARCGPLFSAGLPHLCKSLPAELAVFGRDAHVVKTVGLGDFAYDLGIRIRGAIFLGPGNPSPRHRLTFIRSEPPVTHPAQKKAGDLVTGQGDLLEFRSVFGEIAAGQFVPGFRRDQMEIRSGQQIAFYPLPQPI